jgi:UDP-GlcNAc:undecaprenyl-phosphate GlcNAc-1-phosphate transferase
MARLYLPFLGAFELGFWSYPLVVGWLLLTTNAMNFIDGLDGLAAGIAAIAGLVFMVASFRAGFVVTVALSAAVVGVCVGFLPYNFSPARIFMGDSGSTMLGFVLGVISLVGAGKNVAFVSLLVPILALSVPIIDTLGVVVRRTYRGNSIFEADRRHIHHLLLSSGLGYRRTVVLLYLVSALFGAIALFLATGPRVSVLFIAVLAFACFLLFLSGRKKDG